MTPNVSAHQRLRYSIYVKGLSTSPPHALGIAALSGIWYNCRMVILGADTNFSIRFRSIEVTACNGDYKSVVTFEMFAYKPKHSQSDVVLELSQTVPFYAKADSRHLDYDRTVAEAAEKLKADFSRVVLVLEDISAES